MLSSKTKRELKINQRQILIDSIEIGIASPQQILTWGERLLPNGKKAGLIKNSKTVNYKRFTPFRDGLFCERIFGPVTSFVCACGKKQSHTKLTFCEKCEVEYIDQRSRRYRLGYISLLSPVTHVWYLKGRPSYLSLFLGKRKKTVVPLAYCNAYLIEHGISKNSDTTKTGQIWPYMRSPSNVEDFLQNPVTKRLYPGRKGVLKILREQNLPQNSLQNFVSSCAPFKYPSLFSLYKNLLAKKGFALSVKAPTRLFFRRKGGRSSLLRLMSLKDLYKPHLEIFKRHELCTNVKRDTRGWLSTRFPHLKNQRISRTFYQMHKKPRARLIQISGITSLRTNLLTKLRIQIRDLYVLVCEALHERHEPYALDNGAKTKRSWPLQIEDLYGAGSWITSGERQSRQDKVILPHTNLRFVRATSYKSSCKAKLCTCTKGFAAKTRFVRTCTCTKAAKGYNLCKKDRYLSSSYGTYSYTRLHTLPFLPSLVSHFYLRDALLNFIYSVAAHDDLPLMEYCHSKRWEPLRDVHRFMAHKTVEPFKNSFTFKSTNSTKSFSRTVQTFERLRGYKLDSSLAKSEKPEQTQIFDLYGAGSWITSGPFRATFTEGDKVILPHTNRRFVRATSYKSLICTKGKAFHRRCSCPFGQRFAKSVVQNGTDLPKNEGNTILSEEENKSALSGLELTAIREILSYTGGGALQQLLQQFNQHDLCKFLFAEAQILRVLYEREISTPLDPRQRNEIQSFQLLLPGFFELFGEESLSVRGIGKKKDQSHTIPKSLTPAYYKYQYKAPHTSTNLVLAAKPFLAAKPPAPPGNEGNPAPYKSSYKSLPLQILAAKPFTEGDPAPSPTVKGKDLYGAGSPSVKGERFVRTCTCTKGQKFVRRWQGDKGKREDLYASHADQRVARKDICMSSVRKGLYIRRGGVMQSFERAGGCKKLSSCKSKFSNLFLQNRALENIFAKERFLPHSYRRKTCKNSFKEKGCTEKLYKKGNNLSFAANLSRYNPKLKAKGGNDSCKQGFKFSSRSSISNCKHVYFYKQSRAGLTSFASTNLVQILPHTYKYARAKSCKRSVCMRGENIHFQNKTPDLRKKQILRLSRRIYKVARRLKIVQLLTRNHRKPEWMILSHLPVLPPDLRPILQMSEKVIVASDLNIMYQRVIYRNNRHLRVRFIDFHLVTAIQRLVQDAVDRLIENGKGGSKPYYTQGGRPLKSLSDILKGKKGRFRLNLLGKRVDFSGRSVIVVSPLCQIHECGLPKDIALELYHYFLLRQLIVKRHCASIVTAKKMIKSKSSLMWDILRELMYHHPVLLNRAPTLHRLGIQAFQPKLALGNAILLHPLVCSGFNADFDGDQMGVHLPLSFAARAESWDLLWSRNNLLSPATGQPMLVPSQDMVLGFYYITAQASKRFTNISASHTPPQVRSFLGSPSYKSWITSGERQGRLPLRASICTKGQSKENRFLSLEEIITSLQNGKIKVHTPVWLHWSGKMENEENSQKPLELRVHSFGGGQSVYERYISSAFFTKKPVTIENESSERSRVLTKSGFYSSFLNLNKNTTEGFVEKKGRKAALFSHPAKRENQLQLVENSSSTKISSFKGKFLICAKLESHCLRTTAGRVLMNNLILAAKPFVQVQIEDLA